MATKSQSRVSRARKPGIVCFEGAWSEPLDSRETIEPALRCIESVGVADVVHKDVATRDELRLYLDKWLGKSGRGMPRYGVGMFAFHGSKNKIWLDDHEVGLEELAEMIDGRAAGRVLYLGGCSVLKGDEDDLTRFCRKTRAKGLIGYSRNVEFVEAVAFEILLMTVAVESTAFKPVFNRLTREHPLWTRKLGLRMAHQTWASERLDG